MAIQNQLWIRAAQENLFESINTIAPAATDDGQYLNAITVNIPNAGTPATISKNPARPLTVNERTDNILTYNLDEYVMNPTLVKFADANNLSYDKLKSVVNDLTMGLPERVLREMLISWYTDDTYKVLTSGSSYTAHATAATGNRKGLAIADVLAAGKKLDDMKIPQADRYLIVDNTMFYQFLDVVGISSYRDAVAGYDAKSNKLPMLFGFNFIPVTQAVYTSSAYAVRAYGHAGATTDQAVALAVHKSAVSMAVGSVKIFSNADDATYVGDVVSGAIYAGGSYRRYDKKGVVPIIQANA